MLKSKPRPSKYAQQLTHYGRVLGGPLAQTQHRFASVAAYAQRDDHLAILEWRAVDHHGAQPQLTYGTVVKEFSEAYGIEKSAVSENFIEASQEKVKELMERPLVPGRKPAHHLVPNPLLQRRAVLKQLVAPQPVVELINGVERGGAIWDRFTVHYTPKHGSWLNQAEIEIRLFSRRCLRSRRIPT